MFNLSHFKSPILVLPFLFSTLCSAGQNCNEDIDLYAINNLHLNDRSHLTLNAAGSNVFIGHDSQIEGNITALNSITTGDRVTVDGFVFATQQIQMGNQTQLPINNQEAPYQEPCELPEFQINNNDSSVIINRDETFVLEPGHYGDLTIFERSEVLFKPGEYHFNSIKTFDEVILKVFEDELQPVDIFTNNIEIGARSTLNFNSYSSLYFKHSFLIDSDVELIGNLFSNEGSLEVRSRSSLKGKIISRDILFHNDVTGFQANYLRAQPEEIAEWKEQLADIELEDFQEINFQLKSRLEGQEGIQSYLDQNSLLDLFVYQREEGTVYPLYLIDESISSFDRQTLTSEHITAAAIHAESILFAKQIGVQFFHLSEAGDFRDFSVIIEQENSSCTAYPNSVCWLELTPGLNTFSFSVLKNDEIISQNNFSLTVAPEVISQNIGGDHE